MASLETKGEAILCKAKKHSEKKHSVRFDVFATTDKGVQVQVGALYWPREYGDMPNSLVILKS